nr:nucleotide sugar dehydrogenase [Desulfobacterales bacterium]
MKELLEKIDEKRAVVGIIGLGYVGLPLLIRFGKTGFPVIGFDIDTKKIESLLHGRSYIQHIPVDSMSELLDTGHLQVTTDFEYLTRVDAVIICVPTPLTEKLEPDLRFLKETTNVVAEYLQQGQLVVLESTTYPGTTEEMMLPRLENKNFRVGHDFFLAFSPEREDPGNKEFTSANIPKVVGGITPNCLRVATALYENIAPRVVPVSSCKVAEMTKLLENIYRSVNIALVNELKILATKMGIDIWEVIEASSTKPFGFMPFYPGPGLGGHCIPIDPFYLSWKAREYDFTTRFIQLAGEINVSMPYYVVERTIEALNGRGKCLKDSRILILGIAYKKDIDDDRESPAYAVIDLLMKKGAQVLYNDPLIPRLKPTRKYKFNMSSVPIQKEVLQSMDAVLILTDHSAYDYQEIVRHAKLVIDTRNATKDVNEGRGKIVKA